MAQRTYQAATPTTTTPAERGTSIRAAGGRVWGRVSSFIYLPALLIPALALVLVGIGWATHWGGVDFGDSLTRLRAVTIGPMAFAMIALFLVAERLRPAQRRPLVARGHRHDVLYTVLNVVVVLPLVTALTLSLDDVVRRAAPWVILPRMGMVPRWAAIVAIVVAMDACNWLVHLANHRVRLLWRFHELHHSQEDMNVLTVFRTHPLIHVSYVLAVIPALVLLANGELPTLLLVVYGGSVAFAHSNTNLGFGPLERVFVSPNYHRIHHRLVGPQDLNLGFTLTIWDQLTHRALFPTPETVRAATGLPQRPLKVEQQGARPRHLMVFAAQLLGPFRPLDEPVRPPSIRESAPAPEPDREARTGTGSQTSEPATPTAEGAPLAPRAMNTPPPRHRSTPWLRIPFETRPGGPATDAALVAVRVALAWIFVYYGAAKLFGAFPGAGPNGIHQTALYMSQTAHLRPGELFALLAGLTEFGGGIAMALGFCTRLAGLALCGDMVMATVTVTWATGLSSSTAPPGYQLNLALGALALAAALIGAGRFSIDALISRALRRRDMQPPRAATSRTQRRRRSLAS